MAQEPKIIDLRRSYLPMDPNAFPPTMQGTEAEDSPEQRVPVIPYDGYNFMPTPQGYVSFFGTNSDLDVSALAQNTDYVFVIQKNTLENLGVALCDNGIWVKDLGSSGSWTQAVTLTVPGSGLHKNWSFCVLDADLYVYRQGEAGHWKFGADNSYVFTQVVPTFLNMAGQLGIFKAGGRLGYWDSEDSFSWSALGNTQDFEPKIDTLAGNVKFQDLVGKTVNVLSHGTGFIIYATKSIVHVTRDTGSQFMWKGKAIFNNNGISYRNEVCQGDPDTVHFAMSTVGLLEIREGAPNYVSPEASTYFREKREPIYLQLLNGRYLFLQFLNAYYLQGRINFNEEGIPTTIYYFEDGYNVIETIEAGDINDAANAVWSAQSAYQSIFLFEQYGYNSNAEADTPAEVPVWADNLSTIVGSAGLAAYNAVLASSYFNTFNTFSFSMVISSSNVVAAGLPAIHLSNAAAIADAEFFTETHITQNSADNFFRAQEAVWFLEGAYTQHWKDAVDARTVANNTGFQDPVFVGYAGDTGQLVTSATYAVVGYRQDYSKDIVYLDLRRESERNKHYTRTARSLSAQRTLIKTIRPLVDYTMEMVISGGAAAEAPWYPYVVDLGGTSNQASIDHEDLQDNLLLVASFAPYTTYAAMVANAITDLTTELSSNFSGITITLLGETGGEQFVDYGVQGGGFFYYGGRGRHYLFEGTRISPTGSFKCVITFNPYSPSVPTPIPFPEPPLYGRVLMFLRSAITHMDALPAGQPVYMVANCQFRVKDINVRTEAGPTLDIGYAKQIGYSNITGHGHYTDEDTFVSDDTDDEAPDYDDTFDPVPAETEDVQFNGVIIPQPFGSGGIYGDADGPITVGSMSIDYSSAPTGQAPDAGGSGGYTVTIPSGSILLQEGSIEPIYPTFRGAFVFDLHYKKWGKMALDYKNLLDIYPVNTMAGTGIFPYDSFMPRMGARLSDGTFPIFDQYPGDSEIVFGKIGFYRKGFSIIEEILFQNRYPSTGMLVLEGSIDGKSIDPDITQEVAFTDSVTGQEGFGWSAKWFNIIFRGYYDLVSLEPRMQRGSKR